MEEAPKYDKEIIKSIGNVIRLKRESMGLSQEKFSELTGHHRNYIGLLERGERSPNIATLYRVAEAFKIQVSELLREAGY